MTCPHETDVGALVIGALEPEERLRVEAHLRECPACAREFEELAELPAFLAMADPAALSAPAPVPSELAFQRLRRSAVPSTPRRTRWVLAAAAAAVLAVGGVLVGQAVTTTSAEPTTLTATSGAVHATAALRPIGDETAVTLTLEGVPAGGKCRLVAVTDDGRRLETRFWTAEPDGSADWAGTVDVPPDQLDRLLVDTPDGRTLVTLPT